MVCTEQMQCNVFIVSTCFFELNVCENVSTTGEENLIENFSCGIW